MNKSLFVSFFLSLLTLCATAEEVNTQKVGLFVFRAPKFPVELYVQNVEGYTKVRIGGASTTKPNLMINPDGVLRFYGEPVLNEEGLPIYPLVGRVKANKSWREAFVVLTGVKKDDKTQFTGTSFPLSNQDFPPGSIKFANLSNNKIQGLVGSAKTVIGARELKTIRFKDPVGESIPIAFRYLIESEDKWYRMISTRWAVPEKGRTLFFAFQDPKNGTMLSKSIPIRR